jgi:putative transposase
LVRRSYKYRLYPNRSQVESLGTLLETHRRLYNLALRERRDAYAAEGRSVSRKKDSRRRSKAREKVARLHEKVANQRRDFHHKQARRLVDAHALIAHEALNVKGIARSRLAKPTLDAGWASFLNILSYKAEEAGTRVVTVDPRNTTQACNSCGTVPEVKKTLSERVHSCATCGYTADRDVNAALNILRLGLSLRDETQRVAANVSREVVCLS